MTTESINLTEQQADFIRQRIECGDFQDTSEVVRAAICLFQDWQAKKLEGEVKLRNMLDEAEASGLSDRSPREVWASVEKRYQNQNA